MKVFKFDPKTGKRGELIDVVDRPDSFGQSAHWQMKEGYVEAFECKMPAPRKDAEHVLRVNAHRSNYKTGEDVSYLRDEWITFCEGKFTTGLDGEKWHWTILPPKGFLVKKSA